MPPANIIILGLPGSGKTTLGELMAEGNGEMEYISVGQISRELPDDDERRHYVDNLYKEHNRPVGSPDFFVELVRPAIKKAHSENKGIILDGIPKKPEEIEPLNRLLEEEGIKIDGIVICEVSPFTALQRVIDRGPREGGLDTVDTAINRGAAYWEAIEGFRGRLGGFLGLKIVNVDTEHLDPQTAVHKANEILESIRLKEASANVIDIKTKEVTLEKAEIDQVLQSIEKRNDKETMLLLSRLFVDTKYVPLIEKILDSNPDITPSDVSHELVAAMPEFKYLPLSAGRYADMLIRNVYEPLRNLANTIPKEARLRASGRLDSEVLGVVIREALVTKEIIRCYQGKANKVKSSEEFVNEEFEIRKADLEYTESFLRKANALPDGMTLRTLMMIQPRYWNIFTSSALLGSVDGNYQKHINSLPGSHHSLSVPVDMPRRMIANSMGEYQPFIEAVSTSERSGFDTSLGFLHVIGMDENGKAFQVEWPLLMQDSRLAMHPNALLRDMLARGHGIYFNHDFWHNIVPVYAESFNLYHPHAPIAYGGLMPEYLDFGKSLRSEKEEYEIFVAMTHAQAQRYRMEHDPEYKRSQIEAALTIINDIPHLKQQLIQSDGEKFAEDVSKYFMTVTIGRLLNIIPPDSNDLLPIVDKLEKDPYLSQDISKSDFLKLLFTQRMALATKDSRLSFMQDILSESSIDEAIKERIIESLLPTINNIERKPALSHELIEELCQHKAIVSIALQYIEPANPHAESGSVALYKSLEDMGLKALLDNDTQHINLRGLSLLRWLAIVAPQRDPLKGHMEKVHGKNGIIFGNEIVPPTEVIRRHTETIIQNQDVYEYRKWAREFGQSLAASIYDLLLHDGQANNKDQRTALYILSNYNGVDPAQRQIINNGIRKLDLMLEDLVNAKYSLDISDLEEISELADVCNEYSPELSETIADNLKRYSFLQQQEVAYQTFASTNYATSKAAIENSTMDLLDNT